MKTRYFVILVLAAMFPSLPLHAAKAKRGPKSPEARVRVTGKGKIVAYAEGKHIAIHVTSGADKGKKVGFTIPQGQWPHLGSVFYEAIFMPPKGAKHDFPVHSPMKADMIRAGQEAWFALEGSSKASLQLYQVACRIPTGTPGQYNALVRNAVKLRESRNQPEIARDYQCRLIESPAGSGRYPDDPSLLQRYVQPGSIFPDRLEVKAPPAGHQGHGQGLKSSDVYAKGIGGADRREKKKRSR